MTTGRFSIHAFWTASLGGALLYGVLGCGQPGETGAGDGGSLPDAALACMPGCMDDGTLRTCAPAEELTACPLGCDEQELVCLGLVPSNGATVGQLDGATAGLTVPASTGIDDRAGIDTDTGRIVAGGVEVRAAGEGVVDGIGFYPLPDSNIAVLAMTALVVEPDGYLFAVGSRALVILSAGDVRIQGVVDVSASPCPGEEAARCAGPGGGDGALDLTEQAGGCAPGKNGDGLDGVGDETGGGGGGMGRDGGAGGLGGDGTAPGAGGNINDSNCPRTALVPLEGGSGGGAGGIDGLGGLGGGGGGAIQITSLTRIVVQGQAGAVEATGIRASGGGGGPGRNSTGGGGGGSGGAILLEAPAIELRAAVLAANGGGGGGGGEDVVGGDLVTAGEDGRFGAEQARGGVGLFGGGVGGSFAGPAGIGAGGGDATGGGGGGVGRIRLNVPEATLVIDDDAVIGSIHSRGNPLTE